MTVTVVLQVSGFRVVFKILILELMVRSEDPQIFFRLMESDPHLHNLSFYIIMENFAEMI